MAITRQPSITVQSGQSLGAQPENDDLAHGSEEELSPDEYSDEYSDDYSEYEEREQLKAREIHERQKIFGGPLRAYEISEELYNKADRTNDQLTQQERALLLSRGDMAGKALAQPDSLTPEEMHQALGWSPPEVLQEAILAATGGACKTPQELYANAQEGRFLRLSPEEQRILRNEFLVGEAGDMGRGSRLLNSPPGNMQAAHLLYRRAGMDMSFFATIMPSSRSPWVKNPPPSQSAPRNSPPIQSAEGIAKAPASTKSGIQQSTQTTETVPSRQDSMVALSSAPPLPSTLAPLTSHLPKHLPQEDDRRERWRPRKRTRTTRDDAGKLEWPLAYAPELTKPSRLLWQDLKAQFGYKAYEDVEPDVMERWRALTEAERDSYISRMEALREQAWDLMDEQRACSRRNEPFGRPILVDLPGRDEFMERQLPALRAPTHHGQPIKTPSGAPSRDSRMYDGQMAWPPHVNWGRFQPFGLFWDEQQAQHPGQKLKDVWQVDNAADEVQRRFDALNEQERGAYEERSEKLRQKAWDEWEEYERRHAEDMSVPRPPRWQPPRLF